MKTKRWIKQNILFIFLYGSFFINMNAQDMIIWDYPVKPGTKEWKEMDYSEKVETSQPPPNFLKGLNTSDLMNLCLNYPFNKAILLFNNPNNGFEAVYKFSTVWQEFINRKDAFFVFKKHYSLSFEEIDKINDVNKRNNERFNQFFLEKLVSETSFVNSLDLEVKRELMKLILQKHLGKMNYPSEYSGFAYNSTLSVMIKILASDGNSEGIVLNDFKKETENEKIINLKYDKLIIEYSKKYITK